MHVKSVSESVILLDCTPSERVALIESYLAWDNVFGQVETRVWYLAAIRKELGLPLVVPGAHAGDLRRVVEDLKRRPDPTPVEFDLAAPLPDYQRVGCGFLETHPGVILADDIGVGKTFMSGTCLLRAVINGGAAIVVSTMSTKFQWPSELRKILGNDFKADFHVADGDRKQRLLAYGHWVKAERPVLFIHHDSLRRDVPLLHRALQLMRKRRPSIVMALDEASVIRTADTAIWRAAMTLRPLLDRRWALTATPIENGLEDAWAICEWLKPGYLGPHYAFEGRHIERREITDRSGRTFVKVHKYHHLSEIRLALRPIYLRRTLKGVGVEMPTIQGRDVILQMDPVQRRIYDALKTRGHHWSKAKLLQFLRQVCNSPATIGQPGGSPKLDELQRILERHPEQKVIVFTQYAKFAAIIMRRLGDMRPSPVLIDGATPAKIREHARKAFTDAKTRVLVMTSAGERGLNLQAGSVMVNMDLPWNPAAIRQRIGRFYRFLSPHDEVFVYTLIMQDSVEERVLRVLGFKTNLAETVLMTEGQDDVGRVIKITTSRALSLA